MLNWSTRKGRYQKHLIYSKLTKQWINKSQLTFFRGSFNFKSFKEANQLPSLSDAIFARMRARFLLAEFPTKYQPKPINKSQLLNNMIL
jgi:hypothetical protein